MSSKGVGLVKALANLSLSCSNCPLSVLGVTKTQPSERPPEISAMSGCCVQCLAMIPGPSTQFSDQEPYGSHPRVSPRFSGIGLRDCMWISFQGMLNFRQIRTPNSKFGIVTHSNI
jgi:hypothetical protein